MFKEKVTVSFSIPIEVKDMLDKLAKASYSSNTKCVVDLIRREYNYWFDKKEKEENKNGE